MSTPVVASICSVTMESAREAATQTCNPLGRMTSPRGPPIRVEGVQPAVAAEPTQDTRVSAPLAGSRRNDSTASSSVPAAISVWPSGVIARAEARASPPTAVQPPSSPSLRQPTPRGSCVSAPVVTSRANEVSVPALEAT